MVKYVPTIGIECHVQLKTKTKLFAAVDNDARDAEPNTKVSPICFGMPGTLPYLNESAVRYAIKAGIALKADIAKYMKFDRKHYFYPDLPKGYQITQLHEPIIRNGSVNIIYAGELKTVRIERAHIEEDAGKSTHPSGADYSLVDLNRAGTPLLEIVSYPDMHSPSEAKAYVRELYLLMKYADVSDVDLYYGNMRFDVNLSLAPIGSTILGTRTETKNLNSFKSVEKAAEYEIKRQMLLIEKGEKVIQETRGWDDAKQKTISQRGKEEAHDYRYFPDPDIPPIEISSSTIKEIKAKMPKLPDDIRSKLQAAKVHQDIIETLLEYPILTDKLIIEVNLGASTLDIKRISDWLANEVIADLKLYPHKANKNIFEYPGYLLKLSKMVGEKKISATSAKLIVTAHYTHFIDPEETAKEMDLIQVSDVIKIDSFVEHVIKNNPKAFADVQNGEAKAIGFLVGQVMKLSRGQANPQMVQELLKKKLK